METENNKKTIQFSHTVTMDTDWRDDFIKKLGAVFINPCQLAFPKDIAGGCSYFTEVMPGLKVLVLDFTFHKLIEFTKIASSGDFCIAYYDISDEISIHKVNNTKHTVGYHSKLGMGIVDASLSSTYIPTVSERMYSFRLLISKDLIRKHLGSKIPDSIIEKTFTKKNTFYFYSHIDSRTRVLLLKLKERRFEDTSYELFVKGAALQAFGSLIERIGESKFVVGKLSDLDVQRIIRTQEYLMTELLEKFPGMDVLSEMAGMSASKYMRLFRKIFKTSPKSFFLKEKSLLALELVKSGRYNTISEVAFELGYSKSDYFAAVYKNRFGHPPNKDFVSIKYPDS
ncbi:helix-turn-helix transcriptional regulator [Flavobacterium sp. ACN6]|uniref:helix-turn-helix transcriptional regulator n=1 Tax=Flavobacterium sp. ACN6 TaxID=1920426 RepID=UPI000BB39C9B|nr:AraC family transcriptional regulator [Flavobacterium sp. ACN6]PBJ04605.1 Helix-turn-helix domain protein [Flavobacterium sp. ACN6]